MVAGRFSLRKTARVAALGLLLTAPVVLSGCFLFGVADAENRSKVRSQYEGLANKSVAIVIYTQQSTVDEFPDARKEVSAFVTAQFREHMPTARLVDPQEVINWQDDTTNWFALSEKDIGTHFSVDRVLYIEVLDYSTGQTGGYGGLRGHLRAQCKVFETDGAAGAPTWTDTVEIDWPTDGPADSRQTNSDAIRTRTLQAFAQKLVGRFYEHREGDTPLSTN